MTTPHAPPRPRARPPRSPGRLRRLTAFLLLVLSLVGGALVPAAGAQYADGCAVDCLLGSPWVSPTRGGATFAFRTSVSTTAELRIAEAGGPWGQTPQVRYVTGGGQRRSQHQLAVTQLRGGHAYQFQVSVRDADGRVHREYGTFTTLQRQVEVHVNQVLILDDSDALGAGEITMHLRFGDHVRMYHYFDHPVGTGGILNSLWSRTQSATGDQTPLRVQLIDDDAECSLAVPCPPGSIHLHPNWGTGTSNLADWATVGLMVDTGPGATSENVPFFLTSPGSARLRFIAMGWYRVQS